MKSETLKNSDLPLMGRNLSLDVLRIFACAWVWVHHWTGHATTFGEFPNKVDLNFNFIPSQLETFFRFGYLGVDIFFILSGCVIANSALRNSPRAFIKSRLLRLAPTYLIISLVTIFIYSIAGGRRDVMDGLLWLTGIPLFTSNDPYIGPAWTLHHELIFYSLIAFCLITRKGKGSLLLFANLSSIIILIALIVFHFEQKTLLPNSFILLLPYFLLGIFTQLLNSFRLWKINLIGFSITVMLVIHEIAYRINFESRIVVICVTVFVGFFLTFAKIEMSYQFQFHKSITNNIKLLALLTYPIYLIHLTAGSALIAILMSRNLSRELAMGITAISILSLSLWIVKVVEPAIRIRFKV
jgi:peptidoglycan/LPS O-acetylase OafA/YrhL